jgi:glycerol kinase
MSSTQKYIGAIDQGTTSTRFLVFDRTGRCVSAAQKEHRQFYPQPGWVEHDADEIWQRTCHVTSEALDHAGMKAADLAAVGIANQRETTVMWDRATGKPVSNAIVWQDVRVSDRVAALKNAGGLDQYRALTGLPVSTYFSGLKAQWILENIPGVRKRAEAGDVLFGTIDTFLAWHLTGGTNGGIHVTDVTNASRTQLMDLNTLAWDPAMLSNFEIPQQILPKICSSSAVYGSIRQNPLEGVPLAGILGDQQAALVGQACFEAGEAKNTYGTGCFLLMYTGEKPIESRLGLITTVAYQLGDSKPHYALEGSVSIAGALVQWLRDNLGLIETSAEVETLARTVEDNGGVYFVPAFSGLYAPYWNDSARGLIIGLTRYVNKGHIARAALEATAFQTKEVVEAMERDSGIRLRALRADGGMVVNSLLMQFQANVLERNVITPATTETTALGAAYAAGLAVGFYRDLDDLRANWISERQWAPEIDTLVGNRLYRNWKKAVTRCFDWTEPVVYREDANA